MSYYFNEVESGVFFTVGTNQADYTTNGTDDNVQIQEAVDAANAAGGGTVFIQAGVYNIQQAIVPKSFVRIKGAGIKQTTLKATATMLASVVSAVGVYDKDNPLEYFHITQLEVDCTLQPKTSGGEPYSIGRKGIDINFMFRCIFDYLYIHDSHATGLGIDNLEESLIDHVIVENCGAPLADSNGQGSNGIGLGTGGMLNESVIVTNCITTGIANSAYLLEHLDVETGNNRNYIFANNISIKDFKGISISGDTDVTVANNRVYDSVSDGIRAVTFVVHVPGEINITGNTVDRSGGEGIYIDTSNNIVNIANNKVSNGSEQGILVRGSTQSINGNTVYQNAKHGIFVGAAVGGDPISNIQINDNKVFNNAFSVANTDGIRIEASQADISNVMVHDNQVYDDQVVKTQRYGIITVGGNIDGLSITDNMLNGNKTGPRFNNSTITNAITSMNMGYPTEIQSAGAALETANFTAVSGVHHMVDTSAAITVTAPAAPYEGMEFQVTDAMANATTNNITVTFADDFYDAPGTDILVNDGDSITYKYVLTRWIRKAGL